MPAAPDSIERETLDLATRLIACPSVTPDDAGTMAIVGARLEACGFTCERIDRGGVANLWARHGEAAPIVCLAGHVDVVPPGPSQAWTDDPFSATVRDGLLFGRGAADMKGSVAAMVTAAERVAASRLRGSIAVLLTSDEEGEATNGTIAVVEALRARGVRLDACVVGEPTSVERLGDTIKHGRRGSLNGVLRIKGEQCHIAYPERGSNPIHRGMPALAELAGAEWDRASDDFQATSFQISNLHAGTGANNVIPGTLDVVFNFRFSPASTVSGLRSRVHAILDRHGLDYDLAWTVSAEPFVAPRGGALVSALSDAVAGLTGRRPDLSTTGGTSDGRFLTAITKEVVEFGPVNATIHKVNEHVSVADLAVLSMIYERTLLSLLA